MATYTDQQLFDQAEAAWKRSWEWYFHPETCLFYDYLSTHDPATCLRHLPTPEEIARQYPNPNGWGTGMEDSSISAGVWLSLICDRYEITSEPWLRGAAGKVLDGMVLCATLSPSPGFLLRSVSPVDGRSYYIESSRDQYTWYAYGLWRFAAVMATGKQRQVVRQIISTICKRLDSNVRPGETDYHLCREDGKPGLVDKMWFVDAHEAARLPMLYAIGAKLTREDYWWRKYLEYAAQAASESLQVPLRMRTPYAFLQQQASLEALYLIQELVCLSALHPGDQEDARLRIAWYNAMDFVAGRVEAFSWQCLRYRPKDVESLGMDWRRWPLQDAGGYQVPARPPELCEEDATVREPAEALLAQLMCEDRTLSRDQLALLKQMVGQIDYGTSIGYGLFYVLAAYWRAVRCHLLGLP